MSDNISIIGGADGPTSVFVAGKLGMNWLSTFGLVLVILLLIPNIIYACLLYTSDAADEL